MRFSNSLSERWEIARITQQQLIRGKPFRSSSFDAYMDVGDIVTMKYNINVMQSISAKVGIIFDTDTQQNLEDLHPLNNDENPVSRWIRVNWWVESSSRQNTLESHVSNYAALPAKLIRTNIIQWVPESLTEDVAFVFHINDIINGKFAHTKGLNNVYFCRLIWDTINPVTSAVTHPYYSSFDNAVESYPSRVWGVIVRVQNMLLKLMGRTGEAQKLNYLEHATMSMSEWKIIKSRFCEDSCCLFTRKGTSTLHRYGTCVSKLSRKGKIIKRKL